MPPWRPLCAQHVPASSRAGLPLLHDLATACKEGKDPSAVNSRPPDSCRGPRAAGADGVLPLPLVPPLLLPAAPAPEEAGRRCRRRWQEGGVRLPRIVARRQGKRGGPWPRRAAARQPSCQTPKSFQPALSNFPMPGCINACHFIAAMRALQDLSAHSHLSSHFSPRPALPPPPSQAGCPSEQHRDQVLRVVRAVVAQQLQAAALHLVLPLEAGCCCVWVGQAREPSQLAALTWHTPELAAAGRACMASGGLDAGRFGPA